MNRQEQYKKDKQEAKEWIRSLINNEKEYLPVAHNYIYKLCLDMYDIGYVDGFERAEKEVEN